MRLPARVPPAQIALSAETTVRLNDRAILVPVDNGSSVVSSAYDPGALWSRIGVDAVAGHVFSNTNLEMADRSAARGSVYYKQALSRGSGTNIYGAVEQLSIPMETVTLAAFTTPPGPPIEDVTVENDKVVTKPAGKYRNVVVRGGGTLNISHDALRGGEYFIENLTIDGNGRLIANTASGYVRMYVSGSNIITNGKLLETMGSQVNVNTKPTRFLLVSQSSTSVYLNDVFHGVVIAPRAKVSATGFANNSHLAHRGALFGNHIEVHQGARIITGFEPGLLWNPNVRAEASGTPKDIARFVANLGFLDGTNCERWPKSLTPANYVTQLAAVLGTDERAKDALWLNDQLQAQGITRITAIGSSRSLLVTSYMEASTTNGEPSRRWVAVDVDAGTAFDLSYQRLCTAEDMAPSGNNAVSLCSRRWQSIELPGNPQPVKLEVLGLTKQRERKDVSDVDCASTGLDGAPAIQVPTVLLAAPKVRFLPAADAVENRVDLNVNLIVTADTVTGGKPEATENTGFMTAVEVKPYVHPIVNANTWRSELLAPPRPGLAAIFAGTIAGIKSLVAYDGVRISRLAFVDGVWPYNSNVGLDRAPEATPTVWRYPDHAATGSVDATSSFELLLPKLNAFTWAAGMSERTHVSAPARMPAVWCNNPQPWPGPPTRQALCSEQYPGVQIDQRDIDSDVTLDFTLDRLGARRTYSPGGAALLSAGTGGGHVLVRAPAAPPIVADPAMFPTGDSVPTSMKGGCAVDGCATI